MQSGDQHVPKLRWLMLQLQDLRVAPRVAAFDLRTFVLSLRPGCLEALALENEGIDHASVRLCPLGVMP